MPRPKVPHLPSHVGLTDWLSVARPSRSRKTIAIAKELIRQQTGGIRPNEDEWGNLWLLRPYRGSKEWDPLPVFIAHTDTVTGYSAGLSHDLEISSTTGYLQLARQYRIDAGPGYAYRSRPVLGADCGTGCWLLCEMYRAGCPGLYVWPSDEEVGCQGTRKFLAEGATADRLASVHGPFGVAVSFDRFGDASVVTHQCGIRFASDNHALFMAAELCVAGLDYGLDPDDGGLFTDSMEWGETRSAMQAVNVSVGYNRHHTSQETQDLAYLANLRDALCGADWRSISLDALLDETFDGPEEDKTPWFTTSTIADETDEFDLGKGGWTKDGWGWDT